MLLELFASFRQWQESLAPGKARIIASIFLALGGALVAFGMLVWTSVTALGVVAGGLAGVLLLAGLQLLWWRLLPESVQSRLNLRELLPLAQRRLVSGAAAVLCLLGIAVAGRSTEELGSLAVPLGTMNVVVLVTIAHIVVADPVERAEWSEQQETLWRQRAYARAVKKGLVPPEAPHDAPADSSVGAGADSDEEPDGQDGFVAGGDKQWAEDGGQIDAAEAESERRRERRKKIRGSWGLFRL